MKAKLRGLNTCNVKKINLNKSYKKKKIKIEKIKVEVITETELNVSCLVLGNTFTHLECSIVAIMMCYCKPDLNNNYPVPVQAGQCSRNPAKSGYDQML